MKIEKPRHRVINENAIKFLIGASAFALPAIELWLATGRSDPFESLSASYAFNPWARDVFVGMLFAIGAFMATYNGCRPSEGWRRSAPRRRSWSRWFRVNTTGAGISSRACRSRSTSSPRWCCSSC